MKKTLLAALCALLTLFLFAAAASAAETPPFRVNPYGGEADAIDTISLYEADGDYYLFLPADTDPAAMRVWVDASSAVRIDVAAVSSGDSTEALTPGDHTVWVGLSPKTLHVMQSENIPAVFLRTESGSLSYIHANKENKEPGDIRVYENGARTVDKALKQIKGRGNATWTCEKKPYNIKFDKKTDLFGLGKAKKWTLLASYVDPSLVRNVFGWEFAEAFGLHYTSGYQHVDLFVNGDYLGNYIVCESVEVGATRVDIADLESENEDANPDVELDTLPQKGTGENGEVRYGTVKGSAKWIDIPASPEDVSGGYLLELEFPDRYNAELCGFVTGNGQCYVLKAPELASEAEVRYIQALLEDATNALFSETGYNGKGRHYSEYFDMDSFVAMYILEELGANLDAGQSSQYLYKDRDDDLLYFSPVWDMDQAFGVGESRYRENIGDPTIWWANAMRYTPMVLGGKNWTPTVFNAAFRHADFRAAVRAKWNEITGASVPETVTSYVETLSGELSASALMNAARWKHFGTRDTQSLRNSLSSMLNKETSYVLTRKTYLTKGFAENAAMLYYDANGGEGGTFNAKILSIGETATVVGKSRDQVYVSGPAGTDFMGWNTKADGSGTTYQPGDPITLTANETTLYAVWGTAAEPGQPEQPDQPDQPGGGGQNSPTFWQRLVSFFERIIRFFRNLFGI